MVENLGHYKQEMQRGESEQVTARLSLEIECLLLEGSMVLMVSNLIFTKYYYFLI